MNVCYLSRLSDEYFPKVIEEQIGGGLETLVRRGQEKLDQLIALVLIELTSLIEAEKLFIAFRIGVHITPILGNI